MDMERAIATEAKRWFACFQGPNNEPYFTRELSGGYESFVQLLVH